MADTGLASFSRRLLGLPAEMRALLSDALEDAAEEMAADMRRLAPRDTGALEASVQVTGPGQQTPPYSQPGGGLVVPDGAAAITAGNSEVRYPHLVEYGTADTTAQPFFWPAFRLGRAAAVARIAAAVKRAVGGGS